MKKGLKTNLVLSALLVGIGLFAYWYEFKKKVDIQKKEDAKTKLFSFDSNFEFSKIRIVKKSDNIDFKFECTENCKLSNPNAKWMISSPISFRADESNVGSFVSNISNALISERIPLESDVQTKLAGFGLGEEKRNDYKVEITLVGSDKPYSVFFGDPSPVGENLYSFALLPGETQPKEVLILPSYLNSSLQKGINYWRYKRIFSFTQPDVESFVLNSKINVFNKAGTWFVKEGNQPQLLADTQTIDSYVTGLVFMNATDFVSDDRQKDAVKFGVAGKAKYSIEVFLKDKTKLKMNIFEQIKNKEVKIYATVSDRNYILELEKAGSEKFKRELRSFKFKHLLTIAEKEAVKSVKVKFLPASEFEINKEKDGTWKLAKGMLNGFDSAKFDSEMNKFGSSVVAEFLTSPNVPHATPLNSKWFLYDEAGKLIRSFEVYNHEMDTFVKMSSGDIARMEHGTDEPLPIKPDTFKK